MAIKTGARQGREVSPRKLKLNPTAIGIRRAMALGLGLALATASPAFAAAIDDPSLVPAAKQTVERGADRLQSLIAISLYDVVIDNQDDLVSETGPGIYAVSIFGDVSINNDGSVTAEAGDGIFAYSVYGDVAIDSAGAVSAAGSSDDDADVAAIRAYSAGFTDVGNGGTIDAAAASVYGQASAIGVLAVGADVTTVVNDGSIDVEAWSGYGAAQAYGALAWGGWNGISVVSNYGDISAEAEADAGAGYGGYAHAVAAWAGGNVATVVNDGSLTASADAYLGGAVATGAQTYGLWTAVYSYGDIDAAAIADYGQAIATGIDVYGYYGATAYNGGDLVASAEAYAGVARATGVQANSAVYWGNQVANSGSISVEANADHGSAIAVGTLSNNFIAYFGDAVTDNSGDISVSASAYGGSAIAVGAYSASYLFGSIIDNSGSLSVHADADYGSVLAVGTWSSAYYNGLAEIDNSGDIAVDASAHAGEASAIGAMAQALIAGSTIIDNSGSVQASADADYGVAFAAGAEAISVLYGQAQILNSGDISAVAGAYAGEASAYGVYVSGKYDTGIFNSGDVVAQASADYGVAFAMGANVQGKYGALLDNSGSIEALASASGGAANAYGAIAVSGYDQAVVYNEGDIVAGAEGGYAYAAGVIANGAYGAALVNAGDIEAAASGDYAFAYGAKVFSSYGYAQVYNDGDIAAVAAGDQAYAIGLLLGSVYGSSVVNNGSISAAGDAFSAAILALGGAADIANYGDITGSILTSAGDDSLYNAGTINLLGAAVDLGGFASTGNAFYNEGSVRALGASNLIDMGDGNPLPFVNNGLITLVDGAANDGLTINGDFAGEGNLRVDLDGSSGDADLLVINGDVDADSLTTIGANLVAPLTALSTTFDVVQVNGVSSTANFALGQVSAPADSFLAMQFSLVGDVDGGGSDLFQLGVDVTGLSANGVLASSLAPAVQSLWHASNGSLAQRDGVAKVDAAPGLSLWVRGFNDGGDIAPDAVRDFGSAGSSRFDLQSHGFEAGALMRVNEHFAFGITAGNADADVDPDLGGRARIDGETMGAFATGRYGDFYLDASWRQLDFDIEASSAGAAFAEKGDASGWSLEGGYTFHASGFELVPQLQYSRMRMDDLSATNGWGSLDSYDSDSQRLRAGATVSKTFDNGDGRSWTPYLSLSAVRENKGENPYVIDGVFNGRNDMGGTSTLVEAGATGKFGAWALLGSLSWQKGAAYDGSLGGQLAVRYSFGNKH